jgi:hypothetical protein
MGFIRQCFESSLNHDIIQLNYVNKVAFPTEILPLAPLCVGLFVS